MLRPRIFIGLLLSLFMFQSLWNVAATFCSHENSDLTSSVSHFGHHLPNQLHANVVNETIVLSDANDSPLPLGLQDHHHHLLSCMHVLIMDIQQYLNVMPLQLTQLSPKYEWSNRYKSPHLSEINPPPLYTPL